MLSLLVLMVDNYVRKSDGEDLTLHDRLHTVWNIVVEVLGPFTVNKELKPHPVKYFCVTV